MEGDADYGMCDFELLEPKYIMMLSSLGMQIGPQNICNAPYTSMDAGWPIDDYKWRTMWAIWGNSK